MFEKKKKRNECLSSVLVNVQLMILKFARETPVITCTTRELSFFRDRQSRTIKIIIDAGDNFSSLEDIHADTEHFKMALSDDIHHMLDLHKRGKATCH